MHAGQTIAMEPNLEGEVLILGEGTIISRGFYILAYVGSEIKSLSDQHIFLLLGLSHSQIRKTYERTSSNTCVILVTIRGHKL